VNRKLLKDEKMSNMTTRTIVGFLLGPLVLLCIYFGGWILFGLVTLISIIATWEAFMMLKTKSISTNFTLGLWLAILIPLSFINRKVEFSLLFVISVFIIALFELFRNKENPIQNTASTLFFSGYIGIGIGSFLGIRELLQIQLYDNSFAWLTIAIIFSLWMCDSFAYFGGKLMGRTKLFPRISPNKTWEGSIWGFIASVLFMYLFYKFSPMNQLPINYNEVIVIGILIGMFGQIGDLVESMFKRDSGVKDSSHLIPGHGGFFDRFDSLIFVSPLIFFYLRFIVFPE